MKNYRMTEWDIAGTWYCNCVEDLSSQSALWWFPMRFLGLSVEEFINLLQKYNCRSIKFNNDVLIYNWDNYKDCHAFVLYINKMAKAKKITI